MINLQSYKLITNNDNVVANRFVIYWWNTCYLTIYLYTKGTSELSEPLAIIVLNYNEQTSAFRFSFKIIAPFLSIAPVSYFFFLLLKRKSQLRVSFNLLVCLTDSFSNRFLRPFFLSCSRSLVRRRFRGDSLSLSLLSLSLSSLSLSLFCSLSLSFCLFFFSFPIFFDEK